MIENADGGPSPQVLAQTIVDETGGLTVVASSANTTINTGGGTGPASDTDAYGSFTNGMTPARTLLPVANQNATGNETYAGGIQINSGVCLGTGVLEDEPNALITGRGSGVLGPNNGITVFNPGEIVTVLGTPIDQDVEDLVFPETDPGGGDATVLQFQVQITSPGFLRVSFVFGSDEHPDYVNPDGSGVNDSVGIIIDGQHIDPENIATTTVNSVTKPFNFFEFVSCGLPMFISNDVAPAPSELVGSAHAIPEAPLYDIEFGGFTKKLTREISCPLAPGTYTVKFVVQDVGDEAVDAGVFIQTDSLKLFPLAHGDYDGSGCVDSADYDVWRANFGESPACYYDGDGNGDGVVDAADYTVWRNNLGNSGNTDFRADFNRDGQVGISDLSIVGTYRNVLDRCASFFEGDANDDGAVDDDDLDILTAEYGSTSCGCNCSSMLTAGNGESPAALKQQLPASPGVDGNGTVDESDFAAIAAILKDSSTAEQLAEDTYSPSISEITPTPAESPSPPSAFPQPPSAEFGEQSLIPPGAPRR